MTVVSLSDDFQAFANGVGPYVRSINNVPTTVSGDVTVDFTAFGDFDGDFGQAEWLDIVVEGVNLGRLFDFDSSNDRFDFAGDTTGQYGLGGVPTGTAIITAAEWQTIIADGQIDITYTVGGDVANISNSPDEYLNIGFSWDNGIQPTPAPSIIDGTVNAEWLPGTNGKDKIYAFEGDDIVGAKAGNDTVEAGAGNDQVFGGSGDDELHGQADDDRVFGGLGADEIYGEMGNDTLGGGQGDDDIWGGMGNDLMYGGDNADMLDGGAGNDTVFGGTGDDTLIGGAGDDVLYGGGGTDQFEFAAGSGNDVIYGFGSGFFGDQIELGSQTYTSSLNADGDVVLALSGGGTVTLFGVGAIDQSWFV